MISPSQLGTDVERLMAHLGDVTMPYTDIQGREAGRLALLQWPLLARLRMHETGERDAPAPENGA
ncbi:MAG: hypothetical protein E6R07_05740 [Nevskiaceae bacterium]|nr:MAG: hypothetical protein E6R07_05740 [Nevskiaceae bacterium]